MWSKMCSFASRQAGYNTLSERSGIRSSNRPIMTLKEKERKNLYHLPSRALRGSSPQPVS